MLSCALADFLLQFRPLVTVRGMGHAEIRTVLVASVCYHVRDAGESEGLAAPLDRMGTLLKVLWAQLGGDLPPELNLIYGVLSSSTDDAPPPLAPIMCQVRHCQACPPSHHTQLPALYNVPRPGSCTSCHLLHHDCFAASTFG